jgi:hypothetical protein
MRWRRSHHPLPPSIAPDIQAFLARLRPGDAVELVCNPNRSLPLDVRHTVILDLDPDGGLVVSQPNRPLTKTGSLSPLEATVLLRDRDQNTRTRWGFVTTVQAVITDFALSGSTQEAVVFAPPHELHEANLRTSFRVTIPAALTPPLSLLTEPQDSPSLPADLINFSTGGALVSYPQAPNATPLGYGSEIIVLQANLSVLIEHLAVRLYAAQTELARFRVPCRIVHTRQEAELHRHYMGVAFMDLTRPQEDLLHAIALKLQRFAASQRLI